jgi:hypothetical protein
LAEMEADLQLMNVKGRQATMIARKLEWCCERRNTTGFDFS